MKAVWNNKVIAQSDNTVEWDGMMFFPPDSIRNEYFTPSDTKITYTGKGMALFFHIAVDGQLNFDAAFNFPRLEKDREMMNGYFVFWKGVAIEY